MSVLAVSDAEIYGKYAEELVRFATVLVGPDSAADVVSASVIAAFRAPAWSGVRNPRRLSVSGGPQRISDDGST